MNPPKALALDLCCRVGWTVVAVYPSVRPRETGGREDGQVRKGKERPAGGDGSW